jgi:hypothetical protein
VAYDYLGGQAGGSAGSGIGGGLGALAGSLFGGGDRRRQRQILEQALADLKGTKEEAGSSAYGTDPQYAAALEAMRSQYEQGGMSSADRLAQEQASNDAARADRMRQGAIMQSMAARGQSGGGAELAARLASDQGATEAAHAAGATQAGLAQQRALEALKGWSGMAGQRAGAADQIAEFNARQRLAKAGMVYGGQTGMADYYAQQEANKKRLGAGVGSDIGRGAGMLIGGYA